MANYTHLELDKEIEALAGYYVPLKEERLPYKGREVLYVVGQAVVDASCCGFMSSGYVLVPGYIVDWKSATNENDLPVTQVEPILDQEEQGIICDIIKEAENIPQVEFWR